jgi:RNA polymerase primary sigma factor
MMTTKVRQTSIDRYFDEISKHRLLTPEEEIQLGRLVQRMMELKREQRGLTKEEKREVRRGQQAAERFMRSNLKLVVNAAKKYTGMVTSMDLMDLIQEGNIGLMRGIEKFDPSRGYKFSTYAYWWIRQGITRAIAQKERTIRLPGKVMDMAINWNKVIHELTGELDRAPRLEEIAERFTCSLEEVRTFLDRGKSAPFSLDVVVNDQGSSSLMDLVADPENADGMAVMEKALFEEYNGVLAGAFSQLNDKERDILKRKWGLFGSEPEKLHEIAKSYGVTRESIRQASERAQRKLKVALVSSPKFSREIVKQSLPQSERFFVAA